MTCFFVTGATGAIGSALVPLLLEAPDRTVKLLLRARSEPELAQKMEDLFRFWGVNAEDRALRERVEALRGDVCEPRLGLEEGAYRALGAEVTHIIHSAGDVRLIKPIEEARKSAVESARQVVALAEAASETGQFEKLEFISTVGVTGRTRGLAKEVLPFTAPGFRNTYEQAKSEAESFVISKIESGLPITVHRPSMVVGDSKTGRIIHFQVFYYLSEFFCGRKTYGLVPETGEVRLDIIPADYVAKAIHTSSGLPETRGRVFHLCSGPAYAPRITDLVDRLRSIYRDRRLPVPRLIRLPIGVYRKLLPLAERVAPVRMRPMLGSLPVILDYFGDEQLFDNTQTQAFFSAHGVSIPNVDQYLPRIMDAYFASKEQSGRAGQD